MYKSLTGIAAAAVLFVVAAPSSADAFAARPTPGLAQDQSNVEQAQYRRYRYGRWYGPRYGRWYGPRVYRRAYPLRVYPGAYAYAPYPYYRRYPYGPRPFVQFGPFGFGVW